VLVFGRGDEDGTEDELDCEYDFDGRVYIINKHQYGSKKVHPVGHPIHMCVYAAYAYPFWDKACKGYMQIGATLAYSNITVKITNEAARHICLYGIHSISTVYTAY